MTVDATKSIMLFNMRVLEIGTVQPNIEYELADLKKALHFNRIYQSNTDEIFQRGDYHEIINDYLIGINHIHMNLDSLLYRLQEHGIVIDQENSFEKRLITRTRIKNQIVSRYLDVDELKDVQFIDGNIYYLSVFHEGVVLSSVDPNKGIYEKPLSYNFNRFIKYWKADSCIHDYLEDLYGPTITIRVINSNQTHTPVRIEYHGEFSVMTQITQYLSLEILILKNRYLFTSDLARILEIHSPSEESISPTSLDLYDGPALELFFNEDVLIEYPVISFDDYLQILHSASTDPLVESISLCLYRIGDNPTMFYILRNAVEHGIKVNLNMELCARGEDINSFWFNEMKRAGINVMTYATGRKKVHSKITVIRFRDGRRLTQVGTGNYHSETTTVYTDLSYWTSDRGICDSAEKLFSIINQERNDVDFGDHFLVTGHNANKRLIELIQEQQELGEQGYIAAKFNALDDEKIIKSLSNAAAVGCHIHLIVRGMCTWFPREYLGKNVIIRSVVWDKLEHSRLYCFGRTDPTVYIGSLDLVKHKLENRIETLVQIKDQKTIDELCEYINRYISDKNNSWIMIDSNGDVRYVKEKGGDSDVLFPG